MQKNLTFIFCLLFLLPSNGQKKEAFYDFYWNPCDPTSARYYSTVEKTDSGWLRKDYFIGTMKLQMQVLYEDETCKIPNGNVYYYHANGNPSMIGRKVHGKKEGVCMNFHSNGMTEDSAIYKNDKAIGNKLSWHRNGYTSDSVSHVNDSLDVHVGWFDHGGHAFAGYLLYGKRHGKWQYFHHNGKLSALIKYEKDIVVDKQYFNEDGSTLLDTSQVNKEAAFAKGGLSGWKKYLEKKLHWPHGLKFNTSAQATVGVSFSINEQGKVEDVEIVVPLHPEFDKIAERIIKESPDWVPGVLHNRKVKSWHTQPITFAQTE